MLSLNSQSQTRLEARSTNGVLSAIYNLPFGTWNYGNLPGLFFLTKATLIETVKPEPI